MTPPYARDCPAVDECANNQYATARCRPEAEADNRVVAEGEDGYFSGAPFSPHET